MFPKPNPALGLVIVGILGLDLNISGCETNLSLVRRQTMGNYFWQVVMGKQKEKKLNIESKPWRKITIHLSS